MTRQTRAFSIHAINFLGLFGMLLLLAACGDNSETTSPSATVSPPAAPQVRITVSEALVFSIPLRDSTILFRLIEGDQAPVIAKTAPDELGVVWYQVVRGESFGWIAGSQVEPIGDVANLPTVPDSIWAATSTPLDPTLLAPPSLTPTLSPPQGEIIPTEIQLYDRPDTASPVIGRLLAGEVVDLLGQSGSFYLVGEEKRVLGWAQAADLNLIGDLASIPPLANEDELAVSIIQTPLPASPTMAISPSPASATIPPTSTPRFTPSASPDLASTALQAPTATEILPSPTITPSLTPEVLFTVGIAPPLTIDIPEGWQVAHLALPINNAYIQGNLPFSVYRGPLPSGGTGTIWLIWAFPNITSPSGQLNLYADGVQLLRSLVFDGTSCNIGLGAEQRSYKIGDQDAIGTIFSAVDCEESGDIAGFFAALQVDGNNFAFFAGVEPVENVNAGSDDLQAIFQTVQFEVEP